MIQLNYIFYTYSNSLILSLTMFNKALISSTEFLNAAIYIFISRKFIWLFFKYAKSLYSSLLHKDIFSAVLEVWFCFHCKHSCFTILIRYFQYLTSSQVHLGSLFCFLSLMNHCYDFKFSCVIIIY